MNRTRFRPPIPIPPTPPRAAHRRGWDTRQLSGGQSQLCDRGSASYGGAHEPGNGGRARHAHPFRSMARTRAGIGGGRYDLRERRVLAMASRFGASLPTCEPVTVSTERGAPSLAPSVSPTNRKTIATSVLLASPSTTVVGFIGTALTTTSGHAKSVARARSGHNAPVLPSGALSSTKTSQPDNVRGSWSTRQSSPKHSGKERRWKPCSRN